MPPSADLSQIVLGGSACRSRRYFASVAYRHPDRRSALASLPQIALDRKRPFPLSDDNKEALQLGISGQIPAVFRSRQSSNCLVGQQNPDISHGVIQGLKRFLNGFGEAGSSEVWARRSAKIREKGYKINGYLNSRRAVANT
jgi:hypothetical protein